MFGVIEQRPEERKPPQLNTRSRATLVPKVEPMQHVSTHRFLGDSDWKAMKWSSIWQQGRFSLNRPDITAYTLVPVLPPFHNCLLSTSTILHKLRACGREKRHKEPARPLVVNYPTDVEEEWDRWSNVNKIHQSHINRTLNEKREDYQNYLDYNFAMKKPGRQSKQVNMQIRELNSQ